MKDHSLHQALLSFVLAAVVIVGCGALQDAPEQGNAGRAGGKDAVVTGYTPPERLRPAPEPAVAPHVEEKPVGEVIGPDAAPEGIVADAETGMVAVGLRDPDGLALVDAGSGEVIRTTGLSGAPRHLGLAGAGGPVLVPSEGSDTLFQVGLPDGEVVEETAVDNFPHHAAGGPDGRVFAISEAASTASVIEGGRVVEKIETPMNPGGVAVTGSGLLGIVGVRGLALEVFEADTPDSLGRVDAGEGPTHVEDGPDDRFYVADTRGAAVLVYRARPDPGRIARVALPGVALPGGALPGGAPYGLAVDAGRERLWVALTARNRLVQYDIGGDVPRKVSRYPTVRQPNSVTVNPDDGRVFVAGRAGDELQVIDPGSERP